MKKVGLDVQSDAFAKYLARLKDSPCDKAAFSRPYDLTSSSLPVYIAIYLPRCPSSQCPWRFCFEPCLDIVSKRNEDEMDPVTILGTAGAVADIVGLITKTIGFLKGVHDRWKNADFTIVNLLSQLACLRAALNKISEWIMSDLTTAPQHHQLVMDLEQTLSCCQILVKSMDVYLSRLNLKEDGILGLDTRIRIALQDKTCKDFQEFVQRQTSALTLLLSACHCKTSSEQKALLEKSANRTMFERVQDDSSSLIVLYDNDSVYSKTTHSTGTSSKLSKIFAFDAELMSSPIYQRAVRSLFKRHRAHRQVESNSSKAPEVQKVRQNSRVALAHEAKMSRSIDYMLERDRTQMRKKVKVAILGESGEAMNSFTKLLKMNILSTAQGTVEESKNKIRSVMFSGIYALLDGFEGEWRSHQQSSINIFRQQAEPSGNMTQELASAILKIWQSPHDWSRSDMVSLLPVPIYFLDNLERIVGLNYVPTIEDIVSLPFWPGIEEMSSRVAHNINYTFLNLQTLRGHWKKWTHQLESVFALVFVIDACSYDQIIENFDGGDGTGKTALEQSKALFESTVNSHWLRNKPFILVFYNADLFQAKLHTSPFSTFYPDYQGGPNFHNASDYMAAQFRGLMHERCDCRLCPETYTNFVNSDDLNVMRWITACVNNSIIQDNVLGISGLKT